MTKHLYADQKPKERIALVVQHHILPVVESMGFRFHKTTLSLKRTVGDFQQEIWFRPSRNNAGDSIVKFDPHFTVTSPRYTAWLADHYAIKQTEPQLIGGNRAQYVPEWNDEKYDGWYDLAAHDNSQIIQLVNDNILNAGIGYMDRLSDLSSVIELYLEDTIYYFWPNLIDFCLMENKPEKAVEIVRLFWSHATENDFPDAIYEDMQIREMKLESLGLIKMDPSRYKHLPKSLQERHRVFLTPDEATDVQTEQQEKDAENSAQHRKTTIVEDEGMTHEVTSHVAGTLPVSAEELEKNLAQQREFPKNYKLKKIHTNIRFRMNDVSWNRALRQVATAHDESTGVIWDDNGEIVQVYDFTDKIDTSWNNVDSVIPVETVGFAFGTPHLYFICNEGQILFQLKNNTKRATIKNLYFSLLPYFGDVITAGFKEGKLLSWDYEGKIVYEQILKDKFIPRAYNPQRDIFLMYTDKGLRRVVDRNNDVLFEYKGAASNDIFHFSPDGNYLVEAGYTSKILVADLTQKTVTTLKAHPTNKKGYAGDFDFANFGTKAIAVSPNSKWFVAGCDYGVDVLWKFGTLERTDLEGHRSNNDLFQDGTTSIHFSSDSKSFLTANRDASVILWDVNGSIQAKLAGHTHAVNKAIFGSDEKTIFTISDDMEMRQWELAE